MIILKLEYQAFFDNEFKLFPIFYSFISDCPTKLFSLDGLQKMVKLFTGTFVLNYATTERLLKYMDNNCRFTNLMLQWLRVNARCAFNEYSI